MKFLSSIWNPVVLSLFAAAMLIVSGSVSPVAAVTDERCFAEADPAFFGYAQFGGAYIWSGASRSDCDQERLTEHDELLELLRSHDAGADQLAEREGVRRRYCKLFAVKDISLDAINNVLKEDGAHTYPRMVLFVDHLENNAKFYLECFAGREAGPMSLQGGL